MFSSLYMKLATGRKQMKKKKKTFYLNSGWNIVIQSSQQNVSNSCWEIKKKLGEWEWNENKCDYV